MNDILSKPSQQLIIPLYLDTNILIDLLASLEDGFSMMEQVTTKSSNQTEAELKAEGKIGFPNFLEMFKVNLNSGLSQKNDTESQLSKQRYFTFGSLLYKLVSQLKEKKLLKEYSNNLYKDLQPGDIIELKGRIVKNPLVGPIKELIQMTDAIPLLTELGSMAGAEVDKQQLQETKVSMEKMKKMFSTLLSGFEKKDQDFYLMNRKDGKNQISLYFSIFTSFTRDLSGLEFSDGDFVVLGKVIDKQSKLNLLEKSALAGFPTKTFKELIKAVKSFRSQGYNVPDFNVEINHPTIKIIPIAIYC